MLCNKEVGIERSIPAWVCLPVLDDERDALVLTLLSRRYPCLVQTGYPANFAEVVVVFYQFRDRPVACSDRRGARW